LQTFVHYVEHDCYEAEDPATLALLDRIDTGGHYADGNP
jgi:hypothetical protein